MVKVEGSRWVCYCGRIDYGSIILKYDLKVGMTAVILHSCTTPLSRRSFHMMVRLSFL
jgi:hypothetical protein